MKTEQVELLGGVFCEVIEQLAFMFGEPTDKRDLPEGVDACLLTSMTFSGAMNGSIEVVVPEAMCVQIAGNVLGLEPDDDRVMASAGDALKEVLNVVCGHVLTGIAGDQPVFNLSVPTTKAIDAGEWKSVLDDNQSVGLLVDDMPVLLRFAANP